VSSSRPAWASIVLGTLALAALPASAVLAEKVSNVGLLRAIIVAVGLTFVFGLAGVSASRRARFRLALSLEPRTTRAVRIGRWLVFLGLYLGVVGAIALGFYGVVRALS
jgi:hypothetical protein